MENTRKPPIVSETHEEMSGQEHLRATSVHGAWLMYARHIGSIASSVKKVPGVENEGRLSRAGILKPPQSIRSSGCLRRH